MINQLLQVKEHRSLEGLETLSAPEVTCLEEQAYQLRSLAERVYDLLNEAHDKGYGYLLPVAFRVVHNAKMGGKPPEILDLLDDLGGQELMNFGEATYLVFGDTQEPDIDEEEDEESSLSQEL